MPSAAVAARLVSLLVAPRALLLLQASPGLAAAEPLARSERRSAVLPAREQQKLPPGSEGPLPGGWRTKLAPQETRVDCILGDWKEWSSCSVSCGIGRGQRVRYRRQHWRDASPTGKGCRLPEVERSACADDDFRDRACPVDCRWSQWELFESCSISCGPGGKALRRRTIEKPSKHGGQNCTGLEVMERACWGLAECPVDCAWSEWGDWGPCSKSCGESGVKRRERRVWRDQLFGGRCCEGAYSEAIQCLPDPPACPQLEFFELQAAKAKEEFQQILGMT